MQARTTVSLRRGRKPRKSSGPVQRTPIPADAAIDARQVRCFDLSIQGISAVQIAKLVGIERRTVAMDIRMEASRRAAENACDRETTVQRCVETYAKMFADAALRIQELRTEAMAAKTWPAKATFFAQIRQEVLVQAKIRRQAEDVVGLHAPTMIDASTTNYNVAVGSALAAFNAVPDEMRATMREVAMERKEARAAAQLIAEADAKNITPP